MATVNVRATAICAGGDHATTVITLNGSAQQSYVYTVEDITASMSPDDVKLFGLYLMRVHSIGKTNAQMKSDMQGAGFTVTV